MKELIRRLLHATPSQPFAIYMADGRKFQINHPDFVLAPRENQSWVIIEEETGNRAHQIASLLMTGVEYTTQSSPTEVTP